MAGAGGGRAMATYATRSLQPTQTDIDVSNFEVFAGKQRWHRPLSLQIPKGFRGVSILALLLQKSINHKYISDFLHKRSELLSKSWRQ